MNNPVPELTICIPIGPNHEGVVSRAMDSVKRQTVPVLGLAYHDEGGKGTGTARNALIAQVTTPFVAFLDADDWLEPEFASLMVEAAKVADQRYVYSGWYEENREVHAPDRCYCFDNGWQVHLVTAVIPTEWVRAVGGFDEDLPGIEDTDFFHKIHESGHCGQRVDVPLVHYSADGARSMAFRARSDRFDIKAKVGQKYNRGTAMPCCQGDGIKNEGPFGEKQPGDVLAEMLGPLRITVGVESRRIYPYVGYGAQVWADPRDIAREPARFRLIPQVIAQSPKIETPALTNAADVAEIMEGFRYDGPYVYLPQNESVQSCA
jgi:glycosyltransferase involved in cell wall biosynthesis